MLSNLENLYNCFNAGCTIPQFCLDCGYSHPLFISDDLNLLWQIHSQFKYSKINIHPVFRTIKNNITVDHSTVCTNNALFLSQYHEADVVNSDITVLLTDLDILVGGPHYKYSQFVELFTQYVFASRPIHNFINLHPGVKVLITSTPIFDESIKSNQETTLSRISNTCNEIKNNTDPKNIIKTPIDEFGYSNEEVVKLFSTPPSIELIDGTSKFAFDDEYLKIENGIRETAYQPKKYINKIIFYGTCTYVGFGAPYDKTVSSFVQKRLMYEKKPYLVINASQYYAGRYQDVFYNLNKMQYKKGDIVIICLQNLRADGVPFLDFTNIFNRPHNYGEVFTDKYHINERGYEIIANKIVDYLLKTSFLKDVIYEKWDLTPSHQYGIPNEDIELLNPELKNEIAHFKQVRMNSRGLTGCIVMNCNPYTKGHEYLVNYALKKVSFLYILVVEENRSIFTFEERIHLIKENLKDWKNIAIIPSGKFVISQKTFSEYFNKEKLQNQTIDPSQDVTLFCKYVAPALGIDIRFVGQEPLDKITSQYNVAMSNILPQYGIGFEEVPRLSIGDKVVNATYVRDCIRNSSLNELNDFLSEYTLNWIKDNLSTLINRIIKQEKSKVDFNIISNQKMTTIPNSHTYLKDAELEFKNGNIDKSIIILKNAIKRNIIGAEINLLVILQDLNTTESKQLINEILSSESYEKPYARDLANQARKYIECSGTNKDLNKAVCWMRWASEKDNAYKNELCDMLKLVGTSASYEEMCNILNETANNGNIKSMIRLGRAYRYGTGVPVDLNKSAMWLRKILDMGETWVINELCDVLWNISTSESYDEMISLLLQSVKNGNSGSMGRLGRAYLHGNGVKPNKNLAKRWLHDASELDSYWMKEYKQLTQD